MSNRVLPFVILSAAKNLVLYADVTPFLFENADKAGKKGGIWILGDEILRCAQCCTNKVIE